MAALTEAPHEILNGFVSKPAGPPSKRPKTRGASTSKKASTPSPVKKKAVMAGPVLPPLKTAKPSLAAPVRTSELLQGILKANTGRYITVRKIVEGLGSTSFGTSLMVFSVPEVLPIPLPGISAVVVIPTGIISYQMIRGKNQIQLPEYLLKRSIPRKGFEASIRAILPFLEKAEKSVKPRGRWVNHPLTKRGLGLFILLLAGVIALPIPGTNMPAAIAIFIISLGMVERDGLLIALGIILGLASIALVGGLIFGLLALLGL